jgi:hypothetical protein
MSATQLLGRWRNTDPRSEGIAEVRVDPDPVGIRVGLRVRTREGDREWPSAPCEVYGCIEEDRTPGAAALGMVVLDGLEVELQLRVNKGILCVMTWTRFLDGSRHDYVVRELFACVDTHPLSGTWHNTDASTKGVTTLVFEPGPALAVRAFAAAGPGGGPPIDLGSALVEPFTARDEPRTIGFRARLGEVLLQGNINRGLMILAAYREHAGVEPLAGRFSREFFARHTLEPRPPANATSDRALFQAFAAAAAPDTSEFLGRWVATEPDGSDLAALEIHPSGSGLALAVEGTGRRLPARWSPGHARVFAYFDEAGRDTLLLLGSFAWPDGRSELQIKLTSGTAVVACFHVHGERSWFVREFLQQAR